MNDNDIINKVIKKYNLQVINKGNVELLIESFNDENFYFSESNLDTLKEKFKNSNIKVEVDIKEYLNFDFLTFSNEELKDMLLKSGYKKIEDISIDFPNIV